MTTTMLKMMNKTQFLTTARRVIECKASALTLLAKDALNDSFAKAVKMMLAARDWIIVSFMGKSGHIARKIAATLASTGTPAHFVHPAKASHHGNHGMMVQGNVALVLSNSDETPELADLVAYTRRCLVPLIGITSNEHSSLMRQCNVRLVLPAAPEACGTGVVPTTSTTMSLALLGNTLAVALMEHREFTANHFRAFHPGSKLGARLSRVRNLMHRDFPVVTAATPISDTLLEMSQKGYGVVGVHDDEGALIGIVTNGNLRRHMDGLLLMTAEAVMAAGPRTIGPKALAEQVVMNDRGITCLFVVDQQGRCHAVGILHVHNCLRAGIG